MRKAVIAIGGNAITRSDQRGTVEEQRENIRICCELLADLLEEGYELLLTHGNGPQVGNVVLQNNLAQGLVPESTLDICGAQTQGSLGYLLSQMLTNVLRERKISKKIVSVITQVVVDKEDESFGNPTKFIGPFFTRGEAILQEEKGFVMREDSGRGYRRVVPSPKPLEIVEEDAIRTLFREGYLVITAGGGGIPVIRNREGLQGAEAVIDKDFASALVAERVGVDVLVILTGVSRVSIHFGRPDERELEELTVEECRGYLEAGEFPPGSMGPKVEAAVEFVENSGGTAIITSIERVKEALGGRDGTRVVKS